MRTRIILIALVTFVAGGCGGSPEGEASAIRLRVVAGFYPLAFAAERVAGRGTDVSNITPPGVEPHDVELSPRDVERVRSADLVVYLGGGFQPALEEAAERAEGQTVDLLEGLDLKVVGDGHGHETEQEETVDPHVWLDPLRFAEIVRRIGAELHRQEPARGLVAELERLHRDFEAGLADCERRELVTSHAAFGYLADRYGLEQIAVTGLSPETDPSARELERVIRAVREHGATTIFAETLVSPRLAETVARETGDDLARGDDYFSVMWRNLSALRKALACR